MLVGYTTIQYYITQILLDELVVITEHQETLKVFWNSSKGLFCCGTNGLMSQVDDILDTKLERQFKLVLDKGTLDAIGLHPDGPVKRQLLILISFIENYRICYWSSDLGELD